MYFMFSSQWETKIQREKNCIGPCDQYQPQTWNEKKKYSKKE